MNSTNTAAETVAWISAPVIGSSGSTRRPDSTIVAQVTTAPATKPASIRQSQREWCSRTRLLRLYARASVPSTTRYTARASQTPHLGRSSPMKTRKTHMIAAVVRVARGPPEADRSTSSYTRSCGTRMRCRSLHACSASTGVLTPTASLSVSTSLSYWESYL